MFLSSQRFEDHIKTTHEVRILCEIVNTTGTVVATTFNVISGSVTVDDTRAIRRQCYLTVQDPTGRLIPSDVNDYLEPLSGYFFRLSRGIAWPDGTFEMFPLGTFASASPRVIDKGVGIEFTVTGSDRSSIIARTLWTSPYVIPAGTNTADAIKGIIDNRTPGLRYNLEPTTHTVPLTVLGTAASNDPWADAIALAVASGMELYIDARDIVVLRTLANPETSSIAHKYTDDGNSTVTEFRRLNDASKMYTGVIVYSEGTAIVPPIRVEIWRTDTNLRIPFFYTTPLITTTTQAAAAAASLLIQYCYRDAGIEIMLVPDPRMEAGDIVTATRAVDKLDDEFRINRLIIPLDTTSEMLIGSAKISKKRSLTPKS